MRKNRNSEKVRGVGLYHLKELYCDLAACEATLKLQPVLLCGNFFSQNQDQIIVVFEVFVICSFEIKVSENPSVLNKDGSVVQILDLNPDVSGSIPCVDFFLSSHRFS